MIGMGDLGSVMQRGLPWCGMNERVERGERFRWCVPEEEIGGATLMQRILTARGLASAEDAKKFLAANLLDLAPAETLPGVERAAARILEAIAGKEKVVIYGDYDVDGVSAAAMLYRTIRTIEPEARVETYIPHRLTEGYGLNREAIEQIHAGGAGLVVTVDCGISARAEAQRARELGLPLIITDHHHVPDRAEDLPEAVALVHPKLRGEKGETYPFGELCGAGVAFKLAWRLATMWCQSERVSEKLRNLLVECTALAALGTIADVVPLTGENRVIARTGLRLMRKTSFVGLNALIEAAGLADERIDTQSVGFRLGPRLNACGRMGHAAEALELFITEDVRQARDIAARLNRLNTARQATEAAILEQACAMTEAAGMHRPDRRAIVLAHPEWHAGVVGIVCSRLVEKYGRPVVLMQAAGEAYKGSARSIEGYSIHAGLAAAAEHLEKWGGHEMAAGASVRPEKFEAFVDALTAHANANITEEQLTPRLRLDASAELAEFGAGFMRELGELAPFGRGNPEPTVLVRRVRVMQKPRRLGASAKHLEINVCDARVNGVMARPFRLMAWNKGDAADEFGVGQVIDIAVQPKVNSFRGISSVEGELRDWRSAEGG